MQISVNESDLVGKMYEAAQQFNYYIHQPRFADLDDDADIKRFANQTSHFIFWVKPQIKAWKWNRFISETDFKANYYQYIKQIIDKYQTTDANKAFLYRDWYDNSVDLRRVPDDDLDKYPLHKI